MKILVSGLSDQLEKVYQDYQDTFGFGPCGALAALQRERGWGDVAVCTATAQDGTEFAHYIIIDADGDIIDLANPVTFWGQQIDEELSYTEIEILPAGEMPDMVDADVVTWMRERIAA